MKEYITVIGGGLAGAEAAYQIAKQGIPVHLYEMKPYNYSPAHNNENLAEIVCSNSFKSNLLTNACGLLKEELRKLDSLLINTADNCKVPAGQALAVDREQFAKKITTVLEEEKLIKIIRKEVKSKYNDEDNSINLSTKTEENVESRSKKVEENIYIEDMIEDGIVIIATGPLTSNSLSIGIQHLIKEDELHFYDAQAPIIEKDSINFNIAFYGNRYEQEKKKDETLEEWTERINNKQNVTETNIKLNQQKRDNISKLSEDNSYINLPMNKEEYENFVNELINAEVVTLKEFEKREIFEGCMPIEIMAKRGLDTLRFGPLKPVGFDDPRTAKRPYAVVQLRQDNNKATLYNIVGFQSNLKFGEQKRVFEMIPGLENAEFEKYGVMHRNTFINSPKLLDDTYNLKINNNVYFAGQITGVEGYVESISSGLIAGVNAVKMYQHNYLKKDKINISKGILEKKGKTKEDNKIEFPEETMIGALAKYISSPNDSFQPMNANFGIMPELEGPRIKDKKLRYQKIAERSLKHFNNK